MVLSNSFFWKQKLRESVAKSEEQSKEVKRFCLEKLTLVLWVINQFWF